MIALICVSLCYSRVIVSPRQTEIKFAFKFYSTTLRLVSHTHDVLLFVLIF